MTKIAVAGARGRLGARIVTVAQAADDVDVVAAFVGPHSAAHGEAVPGYDNLAFTSDITVPNGAVYIDVATKDHAVDRLKKAASQGAALLVATTGFDSKERAAIEALASDVPVVISANLSLGVTVLQELVRKAAAALPGYHMEIVELHHAKKRDAPSGTAWALARAGAEARGRDAERDAICARAGEVGARGEHEIGMFGVRGHNVVGEHTVYLFGPNERLELTHRAADRDVFADGALVIARLLAGKAPGLYTMQSLLLGDD